MRDIVSPLAGFSSPFGQRRDFSPFTLFAGGEEGVWYDPSDLTTLFQDTAGTTPVTTPGQTVALMLDKSGNDYHATQSTAAARPTYQVDAGGRGYLSFDGVDDFMVTPTITPGTDKVQVFAGVRRMSAARGVLVGNFAADGYFEIQLNILSAENIEFASEGTLRRTGNFSLPAAPGSNIFTQLSDISGDSLVGRADGVQVVFSSGDQGTGNYLANPIYIGARDGVDLRFNGHIYSLITRFGPNLDAPVIGKTETYVAKKTGVQL
jgi:hypothetical protein